MNAPSFAEVKDLRVDRVAMVATMLDLACRDGNHTWKAFRYFARIRAEMLSEDSIPRTL